MNRSSTADDGRQAPSAENKMIGAPSRFAALPVILHLGVTLPLAYLLNIWMDEASTLYTTGNGFSQTWQNVFDNEKQAPLYFLLLSLWRGASDSIFWARLFSVLCGALAIKFFFDTARRFFGENQARFVSVLFALHPFLIWTSLEIRGYALTILLSVLLLKFFAEGYLSDQSEAETRRAKQRFFFVPAAAIAALYTNYYLGFLLVGFFAVLLVLRKFREAREYFLQMLFVLLAIAPLIWIIKQQFAVNTSGFQPDRSIVEGVRILWNLFLKLLFPTEFYVAGEQTVVSFLRVWFVRFGVVAVLILLVREIYRIVKLVRPERRGDGKLGFGLLILDANVLNVLISGTTAATVAAFLLAAYYLLGAEYVALRHAAVWFVPLGLFVFALLAMVLPRRSWIFFALVFAFLYPYSVYKNYPQLAKRGDWIRVARFIEANERPNQPIVVFQNYDALSLPHYYAGVNRILPDERFFAWSFEDSLASENAMRRQIEFVVSEIPTDAAEIWLATEEICQHEESRAACRPLENFIRAHYTVEIEKDFYLERVRLLRKKTK